LQEAVCAAPRVLCRGGGSKTALSGDRAGAAVIDMTGLAGIVEYEPGEFTFTARAGTRIADLDAALAEHGQFLPFDPPLAAAGATLGGTVAAGLSGPGRYRYGGARDFILGVRYVDSAGQVLRAGGKVVKNAAGFDVPKLMVGSLGELGALAELTFKVFPAPEAYATVRLVCPTLADALAALHRLTASQMDLHAIDLATVTSGAVLWARLSGLADALPARLERLRGLLGGGHLLSAEDEPVFWRDAGEFAWSPAGWSVVKVPLTPKRIPELESGLAGQPVMCRYSAGGQVAWIAAEGDLAGLDRSLASLGLPGLVVLGGVNRIRLGAWQSAAFEMRVRGAMDAVGRFQVTG
jgi:glycolate oxidase FAD binding subunit